VHQTYVHIAFTLLFFPYVVQMGWVLGITRGVNVGRRESRLALSWKGQFYLS
jgi:hypothetical protein